jgi:hypothetical protein
MALGLVFENINEIVVKELNELDLKDISKQRTQLVMATILGRGVLLNDLQLARAGEFEQAVEMKVNELRYASADGLKYIAQSGAGTADMVARLKNYLNEVPNIRMALKATLEGILDDLITQKKTLDISRQDNTVDSSAATDMTSAVGVEDRDGYVRKILDLRSAPDLSSAIGSSRDDLLITGKTVGSAI